ncbi:DoxX family protein [Rhodovarius crocodyli]|uniref:DoxX family protein n=1 Tax=Rhodovarius crocodyli TaxID=1979269 RepID=A0A437MIW2_9PROT|nr:DoxX family protein [Rhodovarius crocodyli]RVT97556.1 DoxX family protein [Rhodovarius crocodyli]
MNRIFASGGPLALSLLRLMSGLLLLQHGTQKMLGFPAAYPRPIEFGSLTWFSGVIELVCGILIAAGLFTRPAAFLASGFTAVAYFMAHAPRGFYPILNGGELAALYSFVFLYLSLVGGGPISLDAKLRNK